MSKNIIAAGLVVLAITGCQSTPRVHESIPPVQVKSLDTYSWEPDKSLALNVAQMARPAGLGIGMEDEENPAEASNNLRDGFDKTTDVMTGMLTSGLVGAASFLSLGSKSDDLRSWRSGLVDFIPVEKVPPLNTGDSFTYIRDYVAGNIRKGLDAQYDDITWKGVFTRKKTAYLDRAYLIFNSQDGCSKAVNLLLEGDEVRTTWGGYKIAGTVFEDVDESSLGQYCGLEFTPIVTGTISINGIRNYIVTTRIGGTGSSTFLVNKLNSTYPGIVLNNKTFNFVLTGGKRKATWNNGIPYVSKDAQQYFFDANETSSVNSL
ncbi:hypothetical protein [Alteromonas gilva]|uniref:Lipoprotein n=1 Tax=Alteromonas gilva TaxID=2987522 RepID=A0ABT5LA00_9ALTE|nr:hypothetical protein [Alteromonas gilva]MDC8832943.1 hypothetical protein [Alteromonas gilva]